MSGPTQAGLAPPPELQGQAFSFEAVAASLKSCGRTSAWNKPTAVLGLKAKGSKDVILLGKVELYGKLNIVESAPATTCVQKTEIE